MPPHSPPAHWSQPRKASRPAAERPLPEVDLAEIVRLQTEAAAFQAALHTTQKSLQPSLLAFLR